MKTLGNFSKNNIQYKDKVIGKQSNLLLSNAGEIIDEIVDNTAELEKTKKDLEEEIHRLEKENSDLKEELQNQVTCVKNELQTTINESLIPLQENVTNAINRGRTEKPVEEYRLEGHPEYDCDIFSVEPLEFRFDNKVNLNEDFGDVTSRVYCSNPNISGYSNGKIQLRRNNGTHSSYVTVPTFDSQRTFYDEEKGKCVSVYGYPMYECLVLSFGKLDYIDTYEKISDVVKNGCCGFYFTYCRVVDGKWEKYNTIRVDPVVGYDSCGCVHLVHNSMPNIVLHKCERLDFSTPNPFYCNRYIPVNFKYINFLDYGVMCSWEDTYSCFSLTP